MKIVSGQIFDVWALDFLIYFRGMFAHTLFVLLALLHLVNNHHSPVSLSHVGSMFSESLSCKVDLLCYYTFFLLVDFPKRWKTASDLHMAEKIMSIKHDQLALGEV